MKINGKQSGSKRSTFWVEANSRVHDVGDALGRRRSSASLSRTLRSQRNNMRPQCTNVVTAGASAQSEKTW